MALIYELDLYILQTVNLLCEGFHITHRHTDTKADVTENITTTTAEIIFHKTKISLVLYSLLNEYLS